MIGSAAPTIVGRGLCRCRSPARAPARRRPQSRPPPSPRRTLCSRARATCSPRSGVGAGAARTAAAGSRPAARAAGCQRVPPPVALGLRSARAATQPCAGCRGSSQAGLHRRRVAPAPGGWQHPPPRRLPAAALRTPPYTRAPFSPTQPQAPAPSHQLSGAPPALTAACRCFISNTRVPEAPALSASSTMRRATSATLMLGMM